MVVCSLLLTIAHLKCCAIKALLQLMRAVGPEVASMELAQRPPPSRYSSCAAWPHHPHSRCKPLAPSVPVHGWAAGGLHLGSAPDALICGNWATVHGKKLAEGALPAGNNLKLTCGCDDVQRRCVAMETCLCMPRQHVRAHKQKH